MSVDQHAFAAPRDERSFRALVARHQSDMVRAARVFVSSRAAAEEVVQEAWIGIWRGLARFQGRCELSTWLIQIVRNCAREHWRRHRPIVPLSQGEGMLRLSEEHWPERRALAAEVRHMVAACIASLPIQQRQVLCLRDIEGATPEETCRRLGLSAANQRVLLHRARQRLRRNCQGLRG